VQEITTGLRLELNRDFTSTLLTSRFFRDSFVTRWRGAVESLIAVMKWLQRPSSIARCWSGRLGWLARFESCDSQHEANER
jgi:hypothetical protein